jgi:hypothetical protein
VGVGVNSKYCCKEVEAKEKDNVQKSVSYLRANVMDILKIQLSYI